MTQSVALNFYPECMAKAISKKITQCDFVGSFYKLTQLPKDRRKHIAIAGRSNVGKSSLFNRLVGRKKMAKVSSTPGKTRALNFFLINEQFYMVDLPGYGYAKVSKSIRKEWGELIEEYMNQSKDLIGLVLLIDCRRDPTDEDMQLLQWLAENKLPVLIAVTKTDKLNNDQAKRKVIEIESTLGVPAIGTSVMTGAGKNELLGSLFSLIRESK